MGDYTKRHERAVWSSSFGFRCHRVRSPAMPCSSPNWAATCRPRTARRAAVCHSSARRLNESWPPFHPWPTFATAGLQTHSLPFQEVCWCCGVISAKLAGIFPTRTWNEVNSISMTFQALLMRGKDVLLFESLSHTQFYKCWSGVKWVLCFQVV